MEVIRFVILFSSLLLAGMALLTWRPAPNRMFAWKMAILAGEFGHWLALLALGVAVAAGFGLAGVGRMMVCCLCVSAAAGLFRPAFRAARLGRVLGPGAFSGVRLYFRRRPRLTAPSTEVFARPEGEELKLDFYAARTGRPAPCLVVVHGGGWDGGHRTQLANWNSRWVAQGWAVAAVSYRLAPRFIWPAQGDDVRSAIAWLKANAARLEIDPARFVILGRSAGGQLATAVGYGLRDPAIRGVVALYGPHDMPFAWSVSSEHDALNSVKLMKQYFGGPPDTPERLARYESASGQLLARPDSPPALLIHGFLDTLAWYRHSERLAARLKELGVPHRHLQLPWATHGFDFNPDGPAGQLADYEITRFLMRFNHEDTETQKKA